MTQSQFDAKTDASIAARVAAEPVLVACVCGTDIEPDIQDDPLGAGVLIYCDGCDRSVGAPSRAEAKRLWQRCMGADK